MEEIFKLIAQYGFPIVAAGYFMIVMNKTIQENTQAISSLKSVMIRMCDKLDMDEDVIQLSCVKDKVAA